MARKKKAPARQILLQEKEATARFDEENILNIKYDPDTKLTVVQDIPDNLMSRFILGDSSTGELTPEIKLALLECFEKVAWIDEHGQTYYDNLYRALMGDITLDHITAVYTQSGTVYDIDSLDSLKNDLVVTAYYDDSSYKVVTTYTLSGTLESGTSTITVSYGGKTATFDVTVTGVTLLSGKYLNQVSIYNASNTHLVYYKDSSTSNRMTYSLDGTGDHAVPKANSSQTTTTFYPIPLPATAKKLVVRVPSDVTAWVWPCKWTNSQWVLQGGSNYIAVGDYEYDISGLNDGSLYLLHSFRNAANDSSINTADTSSWKFGYTV